MKVAKIIAAIGLMTATLSVGAPANAQQHGQQRQVVVKKTVVTSRHTTRGPVRVVHRKVCKTVWRHHRRVRVCR
jgi:hypothetical protein